MNRDLTIGNPDKVLFKFCLPMFASIIFQQLYNIADSFVAGKFIGDNALAAVGNSYEITLIFIAFAFGLNIGCSVVSSQLFGAKKMGPLKSAVYTSLIATAVVCAVLMLFGIVFSDVLLNLIHTPADIYNNSKLYLDIYILGLPFVLFYNISTGIFTALGDSKTPFIFLACSSVANIFMDILFVSSFNMGVAGVAWATFICQGISCILALVCVLLRFNKIKTNEKVKPFSFDLLWRILKIAVPSILQQSFISVGNVIIQGVINSFGSSVVAGYSAAVKLNNMVITSFTTLGNGISNFTAQNLGAEKYDRIKKGFFAGLKLVFSICLIIVPLYFFGGNMLIRLFIDEESVKAAKVALEFIKITSPFYFIASLKLIADGVLKGRGLMNKFMIATFTDLLLRVILAIFLSKTALGTTGIWISWPIGWCIATVMSLIFCVNSLNKDKN